jgi:hypothetical protein
MPVLSESREEMSSRLRQGYLAFAMISPLLVTRGA